MVIAKRHFQRPQLLPLLPARDPLFPNVRALDLLDDQLGGLQLGEGRLVRHDHLVAVGLVLEVIVDPLFLHQPRCKVEVGLAVLDAVGPGMKGPFQLVCHVGDVENRLEDLGHGLILENPAAGPAGEQPEMRRNLHLERRMVDAPHPLGQAGADPAEVPLLASGNLEADRDLAAQQLLEDDLALILGRQVELEAEKLRDALVPGKTDQEQHVRAQRRRHHHGSVGLRVSRRHAVLRRVRDRK